VLDAPEIWQPAALGSLGLAVMTSPTVGAGLEVMAKYVQAHAPNQRLRLVRNAEGLILRNSHVASLPEHHQRFISELVLLSLHSLLEATLGGARAAVSFDFAWPQPVYGQRLAENLGGSARWNASSTAIFVPTRLLTVNSALADATFRNVAQEHLEQLLRSARAPDGVKARVERLLAQSETGRMSSAVAARALSVSQRTLARRLADAGTAHRDLVDAELKFRARRSLNDGGLSRAEIADRLGFADAIGFSRACRRWFGNEA
jgi:AraC-like DNA-binding protein